VEQQGNKPNFKILPRNVSTKYIKEKKFLRGGHGKNPQEGKENIGNGKNIKKAPVRV